ncbi:hypothetical protein PPL_04173 [Heterostelium album PN500]|uniref:Inosine/uridine-preferring nucleoside hydrolase domain-containing protein n=1 Tax=Heterostelium pallidum (strain ATCC 26659 / Pp 5 / PN500) TaxID=670386 RepID=D3B682_HETP5|nr:hypothetical protein PPL_04173 [Heterostelium album PN500]EFA83380.1 hypothetical protein PPL_04173 [Heterostelium album PN500]|eukprot:XP_020435497.1 hypothetical protein PPL_04173 [Heterostelium album PN500]
MNLYFNLCLLLLLFIYIQQCNSNSIKVNLHSKSSSSSQKRRNLFYYTDSNIDDIITLQSIVAEGSTFNLLGICVSGTGFSDVAVGANSVLRVLSFMAKSDSASFSHLLTIPVALGRQLPLDSPVNLDISVLNTTFSNSSISVRGPAESLWNTKDKYFPESADLPQPSNMNCTQLYHSINELVSNRNETIDILITSPLTDLADLLINSDSSVIDSIGMVSAMAGLLKAPANIFTFRNNTVAEFNVFLDVKAFRLVNQLVGSKLLLTTLDATDTNPITREFYYGVLNRPFTLSGLWLQALFESVKDTLTDPIFFNDAHIYGKGFYIWDFESYRVLRNGRCDNEIVASIAINDTNPPNNPNGQVTILSNNSESLPKVRILFLTASWAYNVENKFERESTGHKFDIYISNKMQKYWKILGCPNCEYRYLDSDKNEDDDEDYQLYFDDSGFEDSEFEDDNDNNEESAVSMDFKSNNNNNNK